MFGWLTATLIVVNATTTPIYSAPLVHAGRLDYTMTKAQARDFVIAEAMDIGVPVQEALAIPTAESNFDVNASNASSSASGLWEWLNGSFQYYCIDHYHVADSMDEKNDPHASTICALMTIRDFGTSPWDASKTIWSKAANSG